MHLTLKLLELDNAQIKIQGIGEYQDYYDLILSPENEIELTIFIKLKSGISAPKQQPFIFSSHNSETGYNLQIKSVFIGRDN